MYTMPPGKDLCPGCEDLRPLLHKFRAIREEQHVKHPDLDQPWMLVRPLGKEEAFMLMRFIKHWPTNQNFVHSHIACLFKSHEDIEALNSITLSFVLLGIHFAATCQASIDRRAKTCESSRQSSTGSSADTLPDAPTPSSEPDVQMLSSSSVSPLPSTPEVVLLRDSPVEPVPSTSKEEDGRGSVSPTEGTGEGRGEGADLFQTWSAKELEEFICTYHRVFLPTYALYVAGKYIMQRELRDEMQRKASDAANNCPPYFLDTFTYWVTQGGLSYLTNYFNHANADNSTLADAMLLVSSAFHVRNFVYFEVFLSAIATFRTSVINYLLTLPLEEFRKPQCRHIAEIMWNLRKDTSWPLGTFDLDGLNLAQKFFSCSSHLALRLIGIQEINTYIMNFNELVSDLDPRIIIQLGSHIANWILERHIVEEIFGQNAHIELISRSVQIINFLSQHVCLSIEQLDCIWNAAQLNYISRHVMEMLPNIIRPLEPPLLMHLYKKLCEMDFTSHTEQSINVISMAIRTIWNYALEQKSVQPARQAVDIPRQSTSQAAQIVQARHVRDAQTMYVGDSGSSSEGTSDTSGSGSEDASDSEGLESDGEVDEHPPTKIPPIAALCSGRPAPVLTKLQLQAKQVHSKQLKQACEAVGKVLPIPARPAGPSEEEGSSGSEEDGEEEDVDHVRRKRSPCPSGDSPVNQSKRKIAVPASWPNPSLKAAATATNSAIMEQLLAPPGGSKMALHPVKEKIAMKETSFGNSSLNEVSFKTNTDDDVMTQGSDGADAECNSSTSDMSEKVQDLESDLLEAMPESELGDDEDDDFDMDIDLQSSHIASLINEDFRNNVKAFHLTNSRQMVYTPRAREIAYNIEEAAKPGKTLLWDLIQEQNIVGVNPVVLTLAEKELGQIIISSGANLLFTRFYEACVTNLGEHSTVCVSLRLLTRLIQAPNSGRPFDVGEVKSLMGYFFSDLQVFADSPPQCEHERATEVRIRLNFLQTVYSDQITDRKFRLDKDQLDKLWECLVGKLKLIDELSHWLSTQVTPQEGCHALSGAGINQLFSYHLGKLEPGQMTVNAMRLYHLCLQRLTQIHIDRMLELKNECASKMWIHAMFGENEVSDLGIKHLNSFYLHAVSSHKDRRDPCCAPFGESVVNWKEEELFQRSMEYIQGAMVKLETDTTAYTTIIRCITLMRKQIESYRQRYGFHLKLWNFVGNTVLSHNAQSLPMNGPPNRPYFFFHATINLPDERPQETTMTMFSGQYLGELRAELVYYIWRIYDKNPPVDRDTETLLTELYGFLRTKGPFSIYFRNEELTPEKDEMTLYDLSFRQENSIRVELGMNPRKLPKFKDKQPEMHVRPPCRSTVPMLLVSCPANFEIFFQLQDMLNLLAHETASDQDRETLRKQVAKNLWDFLMLIPTSLRVADQISMEPPHDHPTPESWRDILPSNDAHRLLYALQALENFYRDPNAHRLTVMRADITHVWADKFIRLGGFARLYELLLSPEVQESGGTSDNVDQHRECLSSLIRVVYVFSMEAERVKREEEEESSAESDEEEGDAATKDEAQKKRKATEKNLKFFVGAAKRARQEMVRDGPRFKQVILEILDTDKVLDALLRIQYNTVLPKEQAEPRPVRAARNARQNVVRLAFDFISNWALGNPEVFKALGRRPFMTEWLKRLALESADSAITVETACFIDKMCRYEPEYQLSCALLVPLVGMMSLADGIKCVRAAGREDKPPMKPSPRYFYEAIFKLLEIIPNPIVVEKIDLDALCVQLASSLESRPCYEPRHGNLEDDGLIGLLRVATQVFSHGPQFKFRPSGLKMLVAILCCLFERPDEKKRDQPKCKSVSARNAAYSCLFEITRNVPENFVVLTRQLMKQHNARPIQHWDYWPRDDMRADCGYVGITNLGATCYMATTMQHLYMIPEARKAIIEAVASDGKGCGALQEMQRMFAFLLESERKAYSPEGFCRSYDMNNQMLNPTEQKDMMEFFSDLVAKMEEMSPTLKSMVKKLFTGTNCNTVISLDCSHVSQTTEEFTTVRCQVNNMRNLYESLNDVCVKDVLEGNNMYKCGQCNREVRAEKQACFRNLPEILVLNTLRYTFNMITMQREKVNTHFTFPIVLDMSQYMEENIFKSGEGGQGSGEQYKYELIGVTVHTGTAEGGHYYSFIRDLECGESDHWLLFNDAEVRVFDSEQLGAECFGGDQPKQFDNNGERYLDFGLEKTNSAYMLFYQRVEKVREQLSSRIPQAVVPKDIQQWVWNDTTDFVEDINIYDRYYFDFVWRLCSYAVTPGTLIQKDPHSDPVLLTGQLAISFLWETLIRARDRSHFTNFFDLSVRLAVGQLSVAEWFMRQMVEEQQRWVFSILVQCPIGSLRQTFQRFVSTLIIRLRPQCILSNFLDFYVHEAPGFAWQYLVGRFCRMCLEYLDMAEVRLHWRNLNDLMHILVDFAKLGYPEAWFLVTNDLFYHCYQFYNYLRQLKDVRTPMIGPLPLFPLNGNILEMAMMASEEGDPSDRFSPDLEKDKPNTLSLMTLLLRQCIEIFQSNVFTCKLHQNDPAETAAYEAEMNIHSDIEHYMGNLSDQEQLDFLANLIRDGIDPVNAPRLAAFLYLDKPDKARQAMHFFMQKIQDLAATTEPAMTKKERDRELQIRTYLNALMEMVRHGTQLTSTLLSSASVEQHPMVPRYMDYLLEKLLDVLVVCPLMTYQWLGENMRMPLLRRWVLEKLGCILEWHGIPVGKQQSLYRDDLQIEVARLIVSLSGEQKLRDIFCPYQQGLIFQAGKDKYANIQTAADKVDVRCDAEQHEWLRAIVERVLEHFQNVMEQQPRVFEAGATDSYQWVLFAVQFLLVDEVEKNEVAKRYPLLRGMLMGQLVPEVRMGGNRQAIIQLLAAAANGTPSLVQQIIQDDELMSKFLSETKTRGTEDILFYENEGRYLSAILYLLNVLSLHDGEFASRLAEDPRLIAKLQTALIFKIHDSCRRPLTVLIDTLINQAKYPAGRGRSGEHFRKSLFTTIWDVKNHWGTPGTDLFISPISKRVMEGADEEFQMFAIENKALELLSTNFRICYQMYNANKLLTYLNEEANWCLGTLRKYRVFAMQHTESNPQVKEAYAHWQANLKHTHQTTGVDVMALVEGSLPVEAGVTQATTRQANPVLSKRRQ